MARLYREAPLNSVWEGTANMMCMDVRRALRRDAACREALQAEVHTVRGAHSGFDAFVGNVWPLVDAMLADEYLARPASEALARIVQGVELVRHSTTDVVDAFMATRIGGAQGGWGTMFGTMTGIGKQQAARIVERAHVVRR